MSASVLSTKKLSRSQRELLLNAGIGLVEKDFISIVPLEFELNQVPENLIFTSKNSVELVFRKVDSDLLKTKQIFCVGEKTAALLREKGCRVVEQTSYGAELARIISESYKDREFLFFCGKKRRPELPSFLRKNKIYLKEVNVYDTEFIPEKIDRIFEGVLFFSPSAVKSFCSKNSLSESTAFCIGKTTATEAEKHTRKIVLGTKPTIENIIVQVVKNFT